VTAITSQAWDRFSTVTAVAACICCVGAVIGPIVYGWRALFFAVEPPGAPMLPFTISLIMFIPLAAEYWWVARSCLTFTESGIIGLSKKREIPYGEISQWTINNRTLFLWPDASSESAVTKSTRSQGTPFFTPAITIHPGTPRGATWAAIDPRQAGAIAELLTTHVRPTATVSTKAIPWPSLGRNTTADPRNRQLWRTE